MSDDTTPAFPGKMEIRNSAGLVVRDEYAPGMTLRDWFAGQALAGLMACPNTNGKPGDFAQEAYRQADAMLKARGS